MVSQPRRKKVYPEIQNRKRQSKPKVRTGCKTCKYVKSFISDHPHIRSLFTNPEHRTRRIKCDETKPECVRCLRFGTRCDFKSSERASARPVQPNGRLLQPKTHASSDVVITATLPFTILFHDETEYQYFRYFRDETGKDLAGYFGESLWRYTIPQACQNDVELRNLMVSLAALSRAQDSIQDAASHRLYALSRYDHSIKKINSAINSKPEREATRIALISALLVFCFESLLGEHTTSIRNMQAALKLLRTHISHLKPRYSETQPVSEVPDMDYGLLAAFVRMDNTIRGRPASKRIDRASILEVQSLTPSITIPSTFSSMLEAKNHLVEFHSIAMSQLKATGAKIAENEKIRSSLMLQLKRWQCAFVPLLWSSEEASKHKIDASGLSGGAAILCAFAKVIEMGIQKDSVIFGAPRDVYSEGAMEVVLWSERAVAHPGFKRQFVWDCGIIPPLFVVIKGCRNRRVREKAVEVLKSAIPRRELVWDAAEVAKLGEKLLAEDDAGYGNDAC